MPRLLLLTVRLEGAINHHKHPQLVSVFHAPDSFKGSGVRRLPLKLTGTNGCIIEWRNPEARDGGPVTAYTLELNIGEGRHRLATLEAAAEKLGRFVAKKLARQGHKVVNFSTKITATRRITL